MEGRKESKKSAENERKRWAKQAKTRAVATTRNSKSRVYIPDNTLDLIGTSSGARVSERIKSRPE